MNSLTTCNKDNMLLWVQALRSDRFTQAFEHLKGPVAFDEEGNPTQFGHCCLGVACEVAMDNGLELELGHGNGDRRYYVHFDGEGSVLPLKVGNWLGLDLDNSCNPVVGLQQGVRVGAIKANDSLCWDFKRIAQGLVEYYGLEHKEQDPDADL